MDKEILAETLWGENVSIGKLRDSLKRRINKAKEEVPRAPLPVNQLARLTITPTSTPDEWLVKYNGMLQIVNEYTGKVFNMVQEFESVISELETFMECIDSNLDPVTQTNARIDNINERFNIFLDQYKQDMADLFKAVESEMSSSETEGE